MTDNELLGCLKDLRKMVATLDAVGYAVNHIGLEEDMKQLMPPDLLENVVHTSGLIHEYLQLIEASKRYKDITKTVVQPK